MVSGEPVCTPEDEEVLRKDGSYPSGHTAIGWGLGADPGRNWRRTAPRRSLLEAVPSARAAMFAMRTGTSDVVAGRLVGAAAVAKLHANDEFLAAMDAAPQGYRSYARSGPHPEYRLQSRGSSTVLPCFEATILLSTAAN